MQSSLHREIGDPEMIDSDKKLRLSAALIVFGCVVLAPAVVGVIFSVILIFAARHAVEIDLAGGILFGLISCVGGLLLWFLFVSITSRKNGPAWDDKYVSLLAGFPLDLVFTGTLNSKNGDEPLQIVSSMYEFDFATFYEDTEKRQMSYRSRSNAEYRVEVIIHREPALIEVSKFRGEAPLWHATGATIDAAIALATSNGQATPIGGDQEEAENLSLTPSFSSRMSLHVTPH